MDESGRAGTGWVGEKGEKSTSEKEKERERERERERESREIGLREIST